MGRGCYNPPIMFRAHSPILWACFVMSILLVVFGIIGNVISYKVLGYYKSRRNQSSSFYLRALAVADCITLLTSTFLSTLRMTLQPAARLPNLHPLMFPIMRFPFCNLRMFSSFASSLTATSIIVLFSIERSLVVWDPLRWMRTFTVRRARITVCLLTLACCGISFPALFTFSPSYYWFATLSNSSNSSSQARSLEARAASKLCSSCSNCTQPEGGWHNGEWLRCNSITICSFNLELFKSFIVVHNFFQTILSLAITSVCNIVIIFTLRRRDPNQLSQTSIADQNQDKQVTKRLILVSTVFIVLSFPFTIYQYSTRLMSGSYCYRWVANVLTITIVLNNANYAVNFLIYCVSEGQFRRLVLAVVKCKHHRLTRLLSYMNQPANKKNRTGRSPAATIAGAGQTRSSMDALNNIRANTPATEANRLLDREMDKFGDWKPAQQDSQLCDNDCSLIKDDYSSSMFAEGDRHQPEIARWSQIAPE